jgi:hypothetical protein
MTFPAVDFYAPPPEGCDIFTHPPGGASGPTIGIRVQR